MLIIDCRSFVSFSFLVYLYDVSCNVICVFFFKQKTAYEMRISDWSSDVCSSDLAAGERLHGTLLVPVQAVHHHELVLLRQQCVAAAAELREIGRASCRERVCQYV